MALFWNFPDQKPWGSSMSSITSTMTIPILNFNLLLLVISIVTAKQTPFSYETDGKPGKMLEVGRLPALGCTSPAKPRLIVEADNTWNAYACDINETVVLENAQFMNSSGLLSAGYNYFVIDGTFRSLFVVRR
jgi:hypothetical protein